MSRKDKPLIEIPPDILWRTGLRARKPTRSIFRRLPVRPMQHLNNKLAITFEGIRIIVEKTDLEEPFAAYRAVSVPNLSIDMPMRNRIEKGFAPDIK